MFFMGAMLTCRICIAPYVCVQARISRMLEPVFFPFLCTAYHIFLFSNLSVSEKCSHVEFIMRAMKNCGPVLEATPAQRVELLKRIEDSAVRKNIRYGIDWQA